MTIQTEDQVGREKKESKLVNNFKIGWSIFSTLAGFGAIAGTLASIFILGGQNPPSVEKEYVDKYFALNNKIGIVKREDVGNYRLGTGIRLRESYDLNFLTNGDYQVQGWNYGRRCPDRKVVEWEFDITNAPFSTNVLSERPIDKLEIMGSTPEGLRRDTIYPDQHGKYYGEIPQEE